MNVNEYWLVKFAVYVISGLSAGIAGLVVAARLGSGYTLAGSGFELDAIVAVVLGGTSLAAVEASRDAVLTKAGYRSNRFGSCCVDVPRRAGQ